MKIPTLPISSFCKTGSGTTPSREKHDRYFNGTIPWVKSGELREAIITETSESVTEEALAETSLKLAPKGSVLVAMYGANVGRVGILGIDATTNQAVCYLVPEKDKADSRYIFHALQQKLPEFISRSVGGAQPNINQQIIREAKIFLPPLKEQKRIAEILDHTQSLISKRKEAIALLDILTQSIFIEMFGDNSPLESKWNTVSFGDLLEVLTDYHANGSYEILRDNVVLKKQVDYALMVRTTDLENNNFDDECIYIDKKAYDFLSKSKVYGGEIIINKIGSAGKVYLMPYLDRPVSLGMNAFLIRLNNKVNTSFIYHFLTSSYGKEAIDKNVKGAVTKTITKEAIRGIKTPVPPLPLQKEFAQRVEAVEKLKATHHASLSELQALFASLQHRAFRLDFRLKK